MHKITLASREQCEGIAELNGAMARIDVIMRQNAVPVEESAAASASVAQQAVQLTQALSVFKLGKRA